MKDACYFSHDSNARNDPKILAMRAVFGMEGYGRYWCLIEILRDEDGYKLEKTKQLYDALAMRTQCGKRIRRCMHKRVRFVMRKRQFYMVEVIDHTHGKQG